MSSKSGLLNTAPKQSRKRVKEKKEKRENRNTKISPLFIAVAQLATHSTAPRI
jgi:hypothetical protein